MTEEENHEEEVQLDEEGAAAAPDVAPGETDAQEVEHDLDALLAKANERDEYLDLAQRAQADFENFRKRAQRETSLAEARGISKLARELLPALDNIERALQAADNSSEQGNDTSLAEGVRLVHAELTSALKRVGVESFSPEGETFDPELHEAMAQHPIDGAKPGTVATVYERGYRLGDWVIRPARVVVAQ